MEAKKTDWLRSASAAATNKKADTALFPYLAKLIRGEDLSFTDAAAFFAALADPNADQAQIAGSLTALTIKGETHEELAGMASVMRERAVRLGTSKKDVVDITGTGASAAKTFNVSTTAALVAAGAGLTLAKQCNKGGMSSSGSADVLSELGVNVAAEPAAAEKTLNGAGLCFLFAPKFHPALARMGAVRSSLGIRTCLNLLGVMANPVDLHRQLIGVWHPSLLEPMAAALSLLSVEKAWVVHGCDGLDEITVSGQTFVCEAVGGKTRNFLIAPKDFGLKPGKIDHLKTKSAKESAVIIRDVLASKRRDEARSLVVMNAAAALVVGGAATDIMQAARMAEQSIDSGQAQNKLDRMIQTSGKK
ncbi:MAG: anthranilate phosphoribosyltransferase [Pyrinomonadaceae bacterium]|nr:anthranilate phosphoribosyltransferase [Pyrinomonadaceae bacterium]